MHFPYLAHIWHAFCIHTTAFLATKHQQASLLYISLVLCLLFFLGKTLLHSLPSHLSLPSSTPSPTSHPHPLPFPSTLPCPTFYIHKHGWHWQNIWTGEGWGKGKGVGIRGRGGGWRGKGEVGGKGMEECVWEEKGKCSLLSDSSVACTAAKL